MNAPPSGGYVEATPRAGVAAIDMFSLEALLWEDDIEDLPLKVSFFYIAGQVSRAKSEKIKVAAQVVTRARAKHQVKQTTLTESAETMHVTREELIKLQKNDSSLADSFKLAETGEVKTAGSFQEDFT